jgi:methyl-accepting chemotaxis protein
MAALLLLSVFISHKIAGPVYRFEKSAEELARGRLSHRVRLRSRDELKELQDKLNEMAAALQSRVSDDRRRRDLMLRGLEELSADPSLSPVARERLKALRETAEGVTRDFEI